MVRRRAARRRALAFDLGCALALALLAIAIAAGIGVVGFFAALALLALLLWLGIEAGVRRGLRSRRRRGSDAGFSSNR